MLWKNLGFGRMQQNTFFYFLKKSFFFMKNFEENRVF